MAKLFIKFDALGVKFLYQQLIDWRVRVLQKKIHFFAAIFNVVKHGKSKCLTTVFHIVNFYDIVLYLMW
jgi:hypothetical protein